MFTFKSNEKSEALRVEGNKFYSQRNFFKAVLKYNESLCFAEPESENVGLAYANRSAVYYEQRLYDRCLRNIELAKSQHYPENNFGILDKREEKCKEMMMKEIRKSLDPWNFYKLSYPPNKKIPFIVDCLELKSSEKFGRYVVTNRSLKVGDIVSIEKPFCSVLLSESKFHAIPDSNIYQRCTGCLRDNGLDLIPCISCSKGLFENLSSLNTYHIFFAISAMFCSSECYEKSYKKFHRYECPVMDQLLKSGSVHMALRILFIALSTFDGSIEQLEKFLQINEICSASIFDFDLRLQDEECDRNLLLSLMSLIKSSKTFSLAQHEEILKNHPQLNLIWQDHRTFIRSFLLRQCQTSDLNFHGIFSGSSKKNDITNPPTMQSLQQPIGSGSFLFCSLINHSCSSNVLRICVEGKVVLVVSRPIAKGSQIFDCYK